MIEFSADQTIEQILMASYYKVPRFQRPYSWTSDNTGDFWTDIAQSEADSYFIGAFIVFGEDTNDGMRRVTERSIVDGQQRMTTITILLAAIRDMFDQVGRDDLARGVQGYIRRADRQDRLRFVLETEGGYPYLHAAVQSYPPEERPPDPLRSDEKLIKQAHEYFLSELTSLKDSVDADTTIAPPERPDEFVRRLEDLRDRVLNLTAILVVVQNIDDAYIIFETLNTRGKDLSLADLVRNFLLRDLREAGEGADMPRERFNRLLEQLQETGIEINPADFLNHSWLSRRSFASRRKLFKEIKRSIRTVSDKQAFLRELEEDLPLYIRVRRPQALPWPREQAEVIRSLQALDIFHMTQPAPLVLAAIRAHQVGRTLKLRHLKQVLRAVEIFHFKFTAIAGRSSSGGISFRYARHARNFVGADADDHRRNIDELIGKLKEALPTRDEFVAGFVELGYASTRTGDKRLVQYVLEQFYRYHMDGALEVDFPSMTIEHLAPENPRASDTADVTSECVPLIGNLIFVSESLNHRLANASFEKKQDILRTQSELWVDPFILEAESWGDEEIRTRTRKLAEEAYDSVWSI